jgi:hypothetical protein
LTEFSARLVPLVPLPPLRRAADAMIHFDITNSGSLVWGAFGKRAVTVSYHWLDAARQPVVREGLRTSLPHDIKPGERVELACFLRAPEVAGRMTLVWTLVQENVAWFNDKNGQSSFECEVDIA